MRRWDPRAPGTISEPSPRDVFLNELAAEIEALQAQVRALAAEVSALKGKTA